MWMLQRGVRTSRGQKRGLLVAISADFSWPQVRTFSWPRTHMGDPSSGEGAQICPRSHAEAAAKPPADGGRIGSVDGRVRGRVGVELELPLRGLVFVHPYDLTDCMPQMDGLDDVRRSGSQVAQWRSPHARAAVKGDRRSAERTLDGRVAGHPPDHN